MRPNIRTFLAATSLIVLATLAGCKKDKGYTAFADNNATVNFQGLISSDGCGYVLIINNVTYHPENLPKDFQADNLQVTISARFTGDRFQCGLAANLSYPVIYINSIRKR